MDVNDYHVEEDSDDEDACSSSSEDEIQAFVRENFLAKSDSEDDFETEMENELSRTVERFEQKQILQPKEAGENRKICAGTEMPSKTDVSEQDKAGPSNDDLLYDPDLDAEDEKWVDDQRRACIFPLDRTRAPSGREGRLPTSDAILNCPACMTVLCLDCQCHEIYHTQYRAMFVRNCVVDESQVLRCPPSGRKRRKPSATDDSTDLFNPVRCGVCSTEVAVYDRDEVYHFFNVIASFS